MKKLLTAILCVTVCLSFSGCCMLYDIECNAVGGFDVGYSEILNDAFLAGYLWDGTEEKASLVLPEEYSGIPITSLGGYYGRGVPCHFGIDLTESAKSKLCDKSGEWFATSSTELSVMADRITANKTIKFNVHVGKNIEKIELNGLDYCFGCEYTEDGTECCEVFIFSYHFTCDEKNKTFYAKDGKLYYKKDGALVEGISY